MSFTPDEIQTFSTILEQKLAQHRREMELVFERRLQVVKQELEQRLSELRQEVKRLLVQEFVGQERVLRGVVEQLVVATGIVVSDMDGVEMEDEDESGESEEEEIGWDDLSEFIGQSLDERLQVLGESLRGVVREVERSTLARLQEMQRELTYRYERQGGRSGSGMSVLKRRTSVSEQSGQQEQSDERTLTNMQDVFRSIEQLERLIESMQVATTTNLSLVSNRLYYHQHLPLEHAHSGLEQSVVKEQETLPEQREDEAKRQEKDEA
jgi:hypothetical protein